MIRSVILEAGRRCAFAALLLGCSAPIFAQTSGRDVAAAGRAERTVTLFVLGNVEFLLLHEIAHLLIDEKEIPIVGPEENAADYIAALALLREAPLDPSRGSRGRQFLVAAADAFSAAWITGQESGAEVPYWSDHALSVQRYYQIVCLLYGSNPNAFATVPKRAGLPLTRAQSCAVEYARADRAIQWLLDTYGRRPDDPATTRTEIVYEKPPTRVSAGVVTELKSQQLLDRTFERLHERFTLARPFKVVLRSCGKPEAAWRADRRELVICYELLDTLYLLGLKAQARSLQPAVPRD